MARQSLRCVGSARGAPGRLHTPTCGLVSAATTGTIDTIQRSPRPKIKRLKISAMSEWLHPSDITTISPTYCSPAASGRHVFAHYFNALSQFLHRRFILLLVASYVLAGFLPGLGLWIRSTGLSGISLPMVMLGLLLFNAGLGVENPAEQELKPEMLFRCCVNKTLKTPSLLSCCFGGLRFVTLQLSRRQRNR